MACCGRRDVPVQRGTYGMQAALTIKGKERRLRSPQPSGRAGQLDRGAPDRGRIDMLNFKGRRFTIDVILVCTCWYVAYPLSYRHREEMMARINDATAPLLSHKKYDKFIPRAPSATCRST